MGVSTRIWDLKPCSARACTELGPFPAFPAAALLSWGWAWFWELSLPENSYNCPCVATHDTQGITRAGRQHCQGTSRSCRKGDRHQEEGEEGEVVAGADCPLVPGLCDTSTALPASCLPCKRHGECCECPSSARAPATPPRAGRTFAGIPEDASGGDALQWGTAASASASGRGTAGRGRAGRPGLLGAAPCGRT